MRGGEVQLSELAVVERPFSLKRVVNASTCRLLRPWTRAAEWRRLCGGIDPCAVPRGAHARRHRRRAATQGQTLLVAYSILHNRRRSFS